jgi:hypothetical protein
MCQGCQTPWERTKRGSGIFGNTDATRLWIRVGKNAGKGFVGSAREWGNGEQLLQIGRRGLGQPILGVFVVDC